MSIMGIETLWALEKWKEWCVWFSFVLFFVILTALLTKKSAIKCTYCEIFHSNMLVLALSFKLPSQLSVLRQEPFPTKVFRCKNSFSWEGFCTKDAVWQETFSWLAPVSHISGNIRHFWHLAWLSCCVLSRSFVKLQLEAAASKSENCFNLRRINSDVGRALRSRRLH